MADETIVAIYDTAMHAEAAVADLRAAQVPEGAISLHAGTGGTGGTGTAAPVPEQGFWSSMFGGEPDHDTTVYDRSMAGGSTVVTVKAPEVHVARVVEILESHNPVDIDERATGYGLAQGAATTTTTTRAAVAPVAGAASVRGTASVAGATAARAGGDTIQLAEESLVVGKRVVNRGGTRIRRFVVETPVEQQVSLHEEKVTLDRRPVTDSRPVTDADFSDKVIEMTETAEEAVVAKTARVVEEVGLRKEATDRVETIKDTVRQQKVEIEQIPSKVTTASTTTGTVTAGTTTTGTTTTGTTTSAGTTPRTPAPKI